MAQRALLLFLALFIFGCSADSAERPPEGSDTPGEAERAQEGSDTPGEAERESSVDAQDDSDLGPLITDASPSDANSPCEGCDRGDAAQGPSGDSGTSGSEEISAPPRDSDAPESEDASVDPGLTSDATGSDAPSDAGDTETGDALDEGLGERFSDAEQPQDAELGEDVDALGGGEADAEEPLLGCTDTATWPKRVLFIGNSYTGYNGGLDSALGAFAEGHACSPGYAMVTKRHSPGGKMLFHHYAQATTEGSALHALLNEPAGWDVVVLQDQSQVPGFPASAAAEKQQNLDIIEDFTLLIEATGASLVFFMTWGRRDGDSNNAWLYPDYSEMQTQLALGYEEYAALAEGVATKPVTIAPVGYGWRAVHDNILTPPVAPELATERFESLYAGDGSHPSGRGTYLAAALFFELLTGSPASLGAWQHGQVDEADKAWLDEAAKVALVP